MSGKNGEEFYSFDEDHLIDTIKEDDDDEDEDNEYHEEEYAVVARYTRYLNKAAFGLEEEKKEDGFRMQTAQLLME